MVFIFLFCREKALHNEKLSRENMVVEIWFPMFIAQLLYSDELKS